MTVLEFFGSALLAYGPSISMFIFTIAHDPVRIIILIASAFFWLLSILLSTILLFAIYPLKNNLMFGIIPAVIFQEIFRFIVYKILRKSENGLRKITDDASSLLSNKHTLAYVSGLGFGIISGIFFLMNVIADAIGPGTMGLKSGNEMFFLTSSIITLCFIFLHIFWNIMFFYGLDNNNKFLLGYVICSHLFASGLTFFNHYHNYIYTILPIISIVILNGIITLKVVGCSYRSIKCSINFKQTVL